MQSNKVRSPSSYSGGITRQQLVNDLLSYADQESKLAEDEFTSDSIEKSIRDATIKRLLRRGLIEFVRKAVIDGHERSVYKSTGKLYNK